MTTLRPRRLSVLALLALLPVAAFALGRDPFAAALSAVSVALVGASLYYLFSPAEAAAPA